MVTNSKSTCSKRRFPRLRFSLRTLLLTMLAATVGFGLFHAYVEGYRVQRAAAEAIQQAGGSVVTTTGEPAWLCQLFGEENFQNIVEVDLRDAGDPDEYMDHLVRVKHVKVLIVGGLKFKEKHLDRVERLPVLTHLILDSTSVATETVDLLLVDRGDLSLFLSQRRAIARLTKRRPTVWMNVKKVGLVPWDGFADSVSTSQSRPPHFVGIGDDDLYFVVTELDRFLYRPDDVEDLMCLHTTRSFHMSDKLEDGFHRILAQLPELKSLRLFLHKLPEDGFDRLLARLPELELLHVFLPELAEDGSHRFLAQLPESVSLHLTLRKTTEAQLSQLQAIPRLKRLDLSDQMISSKSLTHIARVINLETLDLRHTEIDSSELLHLQSFPKLTSLNIVGNRIDDTAVATLSGMRKLKELRVSDPRNRVADQLEWGLSEEGYSALCRALPDCIINEVLGAEVVCDEALESVPESSPVDKP